MGQQHSLWTQHPLRPTTATYNLGAEFEPPTEDAPVTWTAANTRLTPVQVDKVMDDSGTGMVISGTDVNLARGIYKFDLAVHFHNAHATLEVDYRLALTNTGGTTVHWESDDIEVPKDDTIVFGATVLVRNTVDSTGYVLRCAGDSNSGTRGIQPAHIMTVTLVGNLGEVQI